MRPPKTQKRRPGRGGALEITDSEQRHTNNRPPRRPQAQPTLALARLRRQRAVAQLHRLGPRTLAEPVDKLRRHYPAIADDIDQRIIRFAALNPVVLAVLGRNRFPLLPMRIVGGWQ